MSGKFILCHGLPGSGKSTWAEKLVNDDPETYVRVNRDDIRERLFGAKYATQKPDQKKEQEVTNIQKALVIENLKKGKTVIDDNTNLNPRFMLSNVRIARDLGAEVSQEHFDIPIEECKRRNVSRGQAGGRLVPDYVIDRMAQQGYGRDGRIKEFRLGSNSVFGYDRAGSEGEKLVETFNKKMSFNYPLVGEASISVDMDGTLFDMRVASDKAFGNGDKNFDLFHRLGRNAPANDDILSIIKEGRKEGLNILAVTGRSDTYADETISALKRIGAPVSKLYMRKEGDFRPDYEIKREILQEIRNEGQEIVFFCDDNPKVLKMWNEEGILGTTVPWHEPQPYDKNRVYEKIEIASPFGAGFCIRCGQPIKEGSIGPKCRLK